MVGQQLLALRFWEPCMAGVAVRAACGALQGEEERPCLMLVPTMMAEAAGSMPGLPCTRGIPCTST